MNDHNDIPPLPSKFFCWAFVAVPFFVGTAAYFAVSV